MPDAAKKLMANYTDDLGDLELAVLIPNETAKRPKKGPGRPRDTDPILDKRVFDAWETGHYKNFADLGRAFSMTKHNTEKAVDRHRKRRIRGTATD